MKLSEKFDVPDELALLYDFVNSIDLRSYIEAGVAHEQSDALGTVAQLESWMRAHGLAGRASVEIEQQVLRLRDSLRAFIAISPDERADAREAISSVNAASVLFPLQVRIEKGRLDLRPMKGSSDFGLVLAQFHDVATLGQLDRLKMCGSPECRWIFFDRSKPANRRWCSSDRCGNRAKTRSYRQRWS